LCTRAGRTSRRALFFFFQAEDGIRDWSVTGVQTCALPIYMTTLQDTAVGPASQNELICPARLLLLAPGEPRAPIAILSPAKRNALVACFNAGGLHKKDGAWHGPPGGK